MLGVCVLAWRHRASQDHVASGCCWQVYSWGLWDVRVGHLFKLAKEHSVPEGLLHR